MKKYLWSTAAIILMAIASCQVNTELTDEQKATIEKEVKAQFDGFLSAVNQLDANAATDYQSKDKFISYTLNTYFLSTRNMMVDTIKNWFSGRERQHIELKEIQVTALTSELAQMTSRTIIDLSFKTGESLKVNDFLSMLWQKEQSGWRVIHTHESWEFVE